MKLLDEYFDGQDFIGCLVEKMGTLYFGLDADCEEPKYMVYSFDTMSDFFEFMDDTFQNWG